MARQLRVVLIMAAMALASGAATAEIATPWREGYNSRVRLVAGSIAGKPWAGIEIQLAPGWKTYWRHPGDGGGVPPHFDFAKSHNVMAATVSFPAPKRLKDANGDAIGYAEHVLFPVRIVPADPARPLSLAAAIEYGICKEICVPVEAELALEVPAGTTEAPPAAVAAALDKVPRLAPNLKGGDPRLVQAAARLAGDTPRLTIVVDYSPGGTSGADAFIEAPEGIYVPQPVAIKTDGSRITFEADLGTGVDPAELKGKQLTLTLVAPSGQSQVPWQLD